MPPTNFRIGDGRVVADCCVEMAAAAADQPFYYHHIPAMSDVAIDVPALLAEAGRRIPNFAGFRCRSPPSLTPGRSRRSFGRSGSSSGPDRRRVPNPILPRGEANGRQAFAWCGLVGIVYAVPLFLLLRNLPRVAAHGERPSIGSALRELLSNPGFLLKCRISRCRISPLAITQPPSHGASVVAS